MTHPKTPPGVEQFGHRHPQHSLDLGWFTDPDDSGTVPPRQHRRHVIPTDRDVQCRKFGQHTHTVGVEIYLLLRLAQRCGPRASVTRFATATGERHLTGMGTQRARPLGQHDFRARRSRPKHHQHRRLAPTAPRWGEKSAEPFPRPAVDALDKIGEPLRGIGLSSHRGGPVFTSAAARVGSVSPTP